MRVKNVEGTKKIKTVEINGDIILCSNWKNCASFEKAIEYPLAAVPLSICHANGTMRKTKKKNI